eukprot:841957-Pelagomonas_calceolata.AAC.1
MCRLAQVSRGSRKCKEAAQMRLETHTIVAEILRHMCTAAAPPPPPCFCAFLGTIYQTSGSSTPTLASKTW